jgi:prepilin-type processing-associated H-X9-DG protein
MQSLSMTVSVRRAGAVVDRIDRLPRSTPDGGMGVEYLGLVYAIHEADRIDVDGRWWYPRDCPLMLEMPASAVAAMAWTHETHGGRNYLFVDGPEPLLASALTRLERAGITVETWGPSFREGPSGRLHDWFVRLSGLEAVSAWELQQALRDLDASTTNEPVNSLPLDPSLRREVERLQQLLSVAEREAVAAAEAAKMAASEFARERNALEAARVDAETRLLFARAALAAERKGVTAETSVDLAALERQLAELASERDSAMRRERESDERTGQALRAIASLEAALEEATRQGRRASIVASPRRRTGFEWQVVLKALAPSLRLVRGSIDFMEVEIADPSDLLGKLAQIDRRPAEVRSKRVHRTRDWLEQHFSTGLGRDGRLYHRQVVEDGCTAYEVLVSDKLSQKRDIDWMAAR